MSIPTDTATGTAVILILPDGTEWHDETERPPYQHENGMWCTVLKRRCGGYSLDRLELRTTNQGDAT